MDEVGSADILIIGAGPAGCAAARLLGAWGHRVVLVDRPGGQSRLIAESIPPSAQKILATLGMLPAVEDAGFVPWLGNDVSWADATRRVETFAAGAAGYQVARAEFDATLLALARQSGAGVVTGRVIAADLESRAVTIDTGPRVERVVARVLVDSSGRAGVIARHGLRLASDGPRTVALGGLWRSPSRFPGVDPTHTVVAAYADGWAWSVPIAADARHVTVMVDPARTALSRDAGAADVYRREIAKVPALSTLVEDATLAAGPWGADATPYAASQYAGEGWLLAGDAATFIDPLSSFGVKKALVSGWLAAVVAHTALTTPAMAAEAAAFFDRREREMAAAAGAQAATFAAEAGSARPHPFWTARAAAVDQAAAGAGSDADPAALARDSAVLAAFDALRRAERTTLRAAPDVRIGPRAAVRGREIVLSDHVFTAAWPEGIRYLRDVDLVTLVRLAPAHRDVGELYAAYARSAGEAPLPDFLGALATLIARRVVEEVKE